jgi:hypothetical protein
MAHPPKARGPVRDFLAALRRCRGDDRRKAYAAERRRLDAATNRPKLDPRFREEMLRGREERNVQIGTLAAEPSLAALVPLRDIFRQHAVITGASGAGKTRMVLGVAQWLFRFLASDPNAFGLVAQDHKDEFVPLLQEILGEVLAELPGPRANALLDRLVVVNPFSRTALVPMQVLQPEPDVDPELQAYELASVINRLGGAPVGPKQDDLLYHALWVAILKNKIERSNVTLAELTAALCDLEELGRWAFELPSPELREFFAAGPRLAHASLDGVRARLHRLLRLPSTRLMLSARESLPFHDLLGSKLLMVNVGSPPLGCEDIGRFWASFLLLKLSRAIFQREHCEAERPILVMADEWQEALLAGADVAERFERLLSMARSRGVALWLISQSFAVASRISPSLPKVVATNTSMQVLFRAAPEDARAMQHLLPVTGRRLRDSVAPWEERPRSPFLTEAEERERLIHDVAQLPERHFYFWNRLRPWPAQLVRALDVSPRPPARETEEMTRRLRDGSLALPIARLEAEVRGPGRGEARPFQPVRTAEPPAFARPSRRPRARRGE